MPEQEFWACYRHCDPGDPGVLAFRALRDEACRAAGLSGDAGAPGEQTYQRYREWLPFHHRRRVFIDRVAAALGYPQTVAS